MSGSTSIIQNLQLALIVQNAVIGAPLPPALELSGRFYARAPVGPTAPLDLVLQDNTLDILWPQVPYGAAWGTATWLAALEIGDTTDTVLATVQLPEPITLGPGDQLRIPAGGLSIVGVEANQHFPYGSGPYSAGPYSGYPPEGGIFYLTLDDIGLLWAPIPETCGAWTPIVSVSGGCTP